MSSRKPTYEELEKRIRELEQAASERGRTEEALRKSQRQLSEITRQVPGAVYQFYCRPNGEMGLYYVSERSEEIAGLKPDLDGFFERFAELIVPEHRQAFDASIEKSVREISPWHFEGMLQKTTGERIWISGRSTPSVRDNEVVFNGIILDITERKKSEQRLERSLESQKLSELLGGLGHFERNWQTGEGSWSEGFYKLLGEEPGDVRCDHSEFMKYVHPDDIERVRDHIGLTLANRTDMNIKFRLVRAGGDILHIHGKGRNLYDDAGRPLSTIGTFLDITERVRTEERLKANELRLKFILDSLPDMILEVDRDLTVLWANKAALDFEPNAVGKTCYQAFPGKDTCCEGCYCVKAFETGRMETGIMHQPDSKTAGESYWENIAVPLKDKDGRISSVLKVSRNVTDRELSRRRERKLQNDLIHAHKMESVGTLAGGIAHDFNNLLGIIIGNNELLDDDTPDWSPSKGYIREIHNAGLRARDVVRQLLAFGRKDDSAKKPIRIASVVEESIRLIRSTIPANIEIERDISDEVDIVYGNATQINQLLINLCANAKDSVIDSGGSIQVGLRNVTIDEKMTFKYPSLAPGKYVGLTVRDSGTGMDSETLKRIFDPYFTTKEIGKGTGIGLAVVHGIVESHGGKIFVESRQGKGTVFTIFFPSCIGESERIPEKAPSLPEGSERVLFVDDEPAIKMLGKQRLEKLGYFVRGTTDPKEAFEIFKDDPDAFDLVVTDMAMPKMTGEQLATEILKIRPDMPVLLCTGYSEKISKSKAHEIGIRGFVMKPVGRGDFAVAVRKALDDD